MKRTPLGILLVFILIGTSLFGPPAAAAGPLPPAEDVNLDPFLAAIGEVTGLRAAYTADAPGCAFDAGYGVYLCPDAAPAAVPQRDPQAAARAREALYSTGILLMPDSTAKRVIAFDPVTGDVIDPDFIPADDAHLSTPINAILSAGRDSILVSDQIDDVVQEYALDGTYIGVFAPAGGPNTAILDNIRGISLRPNGNLLVTVASSGNANSVAEFDTAGNYLGQFITTGAGGISSPFDIYGRAADWLVSTSTSAGVYRFDLTGAFLNVFALFSSFGEQENEAANGNVLVANFSGTQTGVLEYTSTGTFIALYNPTGTTGNRGVFELGNGNILTSNGSGVYEINRANTLVSTKITGVSGRFIEYVQLTPPLTLEKTAGTDPAVCATTGVITVTTGTDVTYCYTITNNDEITYTTHTLVDDHLGTLLSNFAFNLAPGASAFITETANITETTINTADWTATDGTITNTVTVSDTAVVNVASPSLRLVKTVGDNPAVCATTDVLQVPSGSQVTYCYTVINDGGVTWTEHDLIDDQLGTILIEFPYSLAPGASVFVTQTAIITQSVINQATWTGHAGAVQISASDGAAVIVDGPAEMLTCNGPAVTFGTAGIPLGWIVVDNEGTGMVWGDLDSCGETNYTGTGSAACASSDVYGAGEFDTELRSAPFDLSGQSTASLDYLANYQNYSNLDYLDLDISTDDGATWTTLLSWNEDHGAFRAGPGVAVNVDLSAYAGMSGLRVRWHYYDPNAGDYDWYAQIDDVALSCGAPPAIGVTPGTFDLSVPQGYYATVTLPMSITNTGGSDLTWDIVEENGTAPGAPQAVLYDNGPLVTHPGGGAGGLDASALQTALGMNTYGAGNQISAGNRTADDVTVTAAAGWQVDTITFYGYQTGSGTTPTINDIRLQIWNAAPTDPGAAVIWGDLTTNRLASATFSNIYRVLDTALTNTDRPIMAIVANVGTTLPAGTYWLDWTVGGTGASGPWAPAISILGQTTTGNALQYTTSSGAWAALNDSGTLTQQGLPFVVEGSLAGCTPTDIPWLSTNPTAGTTAPAATSPVDVIYENMGALAVGTYTGRVCVNSNDPVVPVVSVPVTLTVNNPTAVALTGVAASSTATAAWLLVPLAAVLAAAGAIALRRKRNG